MKKLKIAIGSDHAGFELKKKIKNFLKNEGYEFHDFGTHDGSPVDYPIIAKDVARSVSAGLYDRGIVICGSGLGVAIAANKVEGIRAVTCQESYTAKMSRLHNNANVLTLGERVIGELVAYEIVKTWLEAEFEGGRHQHRVDLIDEY